MPKLKDNPLVDFYAKMSITTDHHQSPIEDHLALREKLYCQLGALPLLFNGRKVLEVGPGRAWNALAPLHWGAQMDFIEPNPIAREGLVQLMREHHIPEDRWNVNPDRIEDVEVNEQYDIVIAEGFIPGTFQQEKVLGKIKNFLNPGGLAIVTTLDDISYFMEALRRAVAFHLFDSLAIRDFEEQRKLAMTAFASHIEEMQYMTRTLEDWVNDVIFCPAVHADFFSIRDAVEGFGEDFTSVGVSPNFACDMYWHKNLNVSRNEALLEQFDKKHHIFISTTTENSERTAKENQRLFKQCEGFRMMAKRFEAEPEKTLRKEIVTQLKAISDDVATFDTKAALAINDAMLLLLDDKVTTSKIATAPHLKAVFGRGQQFISLMKKRSA